MTWCGLNRDKHLKSHCILEFLGKIKNVRHGEDSGGVSWFPEQREQQLPVTLVVTAFWACCQMLKATCAMVKDGGGLG